MKGLVVGIALLGLVSVSGCVIEATTCGAGEFMVNGVCYRSGGSCDFINDMDCVNRTQAWWCATDGTIRLIDCQTAPMSGGGCADSGMPYTCCGQSIVDYDNRCQCCATADCSGVSTCHI
jgi:hypothetical protein